MSISPGRHIPAQLTSFIGRVGETAEIRGELARTRLLTLTGPGGVGKTRLALRAAEQESSTYPDGIWFVDLAAIVDGALVPQVVARTLEVRERPDERIIATLRTALNDRRLLLILDNCEHVLAACVELIDSLLRGCPNVTILATTREVLGIGAERVWRVPSLRVAEAAPEITAAGVAKSEAATLFVERASAVQTEITLTSVNLAAVEDICRRLDGIPLAIELAAARTRHLAVQQIAAHLDDRFRLLTTGGRSAPTRQQTIRATIDWSYHVLSDAEQLLFDRCSVFAGGWTLEAAETITGGDGIDARDVLDLLGRLVDRSLVLAELVSSNAVRYRTLETLREYGNEHLAQRGRLEVESTEQRHVQFFSDLVDRAYPALGSFDEGLVQVLGREQDNCRAALHQAITTGHADAALRLAGGLFPFWLRGRLSEGRAWLTQALALPDERPNALEPVTAEIGMAKDSRERISLHHRARALHSLGTIAFSQGDYDAALDAFAEALKLWRQLGDGTGVSFVLNGLGHTQAYKGNLTAGRDLLEAGIVAARAARQPVGLALGLAFLSRVEHDSEDVVRARELAEEAFVLASEAGDTRAICISLEALGDVAYTEGDHARASELLQQSHAAAHRDGYSIFTSLASAGLARLAADRGDYASACELVSESLRLAYQVGEKRVIALALEHTALLATAADRSETLRLLAVAARAREIAGVPMRPTERERVDPCVTSARASLGEAATRLWEEGQRMPLDRAVSVAMDLLRTLASRLSEVEARRGTGHESERRPAGLSPREVEVLRLLASGNTSKQIATELVTSVHTVNNQIASIYTKIGAARKADAVSFAIRTGLV
jgi:non-specific serine/threonine protein kinase